jgi:hypothetical protein
MIPLLFLIYLCPIEIQCSDDWLHALWLSWTPREQGPRPHDASWLHSKMQYLDDGETVYNFIHNFGKTNRVGHLETKTFCNHPNPRMDTSAHLGMNTLLHFCVLCEPFPDFLDGHDNMTRSVFSLSHSYHSTYPPFYSEFELECHIKAPGINTKKVTHQL